MSHFGLYNTRIEINSEEESRAIYTGATNSGGRDYSLKFEVSGGEVRLTNKAIRIWKRIK